MTRVEARVERLALAREIARRLATPPEVHASFLAGSVTEGFGNLTSDIDVYLVGPELAAERRQLGLGAIRVDVHRLPADWLAAMVEQVLGARLPSDGSVLPVADRDLALAARLATAEVLTGADRLAPVRERIHRGRERLRRLLVFKWLSTAHADLEDLHGLRAGGEQDAATMVARSALVAAGKAVAAAGGELYAGQKWVWAQLRRTTPDGFPLADFEFLLRRDPLAAATPSLADLEDFTQTCLAAAATLGWQSSLARQGPVWPAWRGGSGPLRRAPGFHPRAYDDAVVVTRPAARRVRLRADVALVWGLCNGVEEGDVVAGAAALRGSAPAYEDLSTDRCREVLARLVESRLVTAG